MKGKITNLFIAIINILLGALIIINTYFIPQDITLLTVQELTVSQIVLKITYVLTIAICIIDLYQYGTNKDNKEMKTGYLFGIFTLSFLIMKLPAISLLPIISGLMVISSAFKDNAIDVDSTTALSCLSILGLIIVVVVGMGYFYKNIGQYMKNKDNKNALKYSQDFFKYVTELDIDEPYINVKVRGKYGYITPSGKKTIDFQYDYASPFVEITAFNKKFHIALVSQDGMAFIIMKNERKVMSFKSEISDLDYEAKIEELRGIYENTLKQKEKMKFEIGEINQKSRLVKSGDDVTDYTYKYNYSNSYYIMITESKMGLNDKYQLARKDNPSIRIDLDCANLDYDEENLYMFSNGTIPFYDIDKNEQGWFTTYGKKKTMSGKAQILDFIDDKILIRDYNDNTIYFIKSNYEKISDNYKEICMFDGGYIVKNENNKYCVIDKNFQKKFEDEFDIVNVRLLKSGIIAVANYDRAIEFNDYNFSIMNYKIITTNGDVILDNVEQVYDSFYKISNEKTEPYVTRYNEILKEIKTLNVSFVGDKFYDQYIKNMFN